MFSSHMVVEYIADIKSAARPRGIERERRCALLHFLYIEMHYWRCLEQLTQPGVTLVCKMGKKKEESEEKKKERYRGGGGAFKQGDVPPPNCLWLCLSEERSNFSVLESENNINKSLQRLQTGKENWSKPAELKTCVKHPAHINHWPGLRHPLAAHKHCSLSMTSHKAPSQFPAFPLNRFKRFVQIFSFSFLVVFAFVFWHLHVHCRLRCQ